MTAPTCTRAPCPKNCTYPFCLDRTPASDRAALQADLDILAGKLTGRYQQRRDDAALSQQIEHATQTGVTL